MKKLHSQEDGVRQPFCIGNLPCRQTRDSLHYYRAHCSEKNKTKDCEFHPYQILAGGFTKKQKPQWHMSLARIGVFGRPMTLKSIHGEAWFWKAASCMVVRKQNIVDKNTAQSSKILEIVVALCFFDNINLRHMILLSVASIGGVKLWEIWPTSTSYGSPASKHVGSANRETGDTNQKINQDYASPVVVSYQFVMQALEIGSYTA